MSIGPSLPFSLARTSSPVVLTVAPTLFSRPCRCFPHTPFFYFIQILCNSVTEC
nr:MAG TPA: hypothetical protein [Bacteriophage sp.]